MGDYIASCLKNDLDQSLQRRLVKAVPEAISSSIRWTNPHPKIREEPTLRGLWES
jgi:hypothetical protein